jgi:hypothetical protein
LRKERSWLLRLRCKGSIREEAKFEEKLNELLEKGEIFFPPESEAERLNGELGEKKTDEEVLKRCLMKLQERGDAMKGGKA